jgi:hypothetical protein
MNTSIPNELLDEIHDHLSDYAAAMRAVCVDAEYARLDGVAGEARSRLDAIQKNINDLRRCRTGEPLNE